MCLAIWKMVSSAITTWYNNNGLRTRVILDFVDHNVGWGTLHDITRATSITGAHVCTITLCLELRTLELMVAKSFARNFHSDAAILKYHFSQSASRKHPTWDKVSHLVLFMRSMLTANLTLKKTQIIVWKTWPEFLVMMIIAVMNFIKQFSW